jgi:hypothetical protein
VLVTFETAKKEKVANQNMRQRGEKSLRLAVEANPTFWRWLPRAAAVTESEKTRRPRWGFGGKQDGAAAQLDFLGFLPLRAS